MNRLKDLRQNKKLTQQELANEMGITKRTYIYWEKGDRQIKPEKAQQLADFFGVSVGYLLGYNDEVMTFESGREFENKRMNTLNTIFLSELQKSKEKDSIKIDILATIKFLESTLEKITKHSKNCENSYITDLQKALDTLNNLADVLIEKKVGNDEK
nr:MAG TPA: Repressor protein CI [Caudoviricetes sp.]